MRVTEPGPGQPLHQDVSIELRMTARAGKGPDICHQPDICFSEQVGHLLG
jgi:hypothetical protein